MLFVVLMLFGVVMLPLIMQDNTVETSEVDPPDTDDGSNGDGTLRGTQRADLLAAAADTTLIQGLGGDDSITSAEDFLEITVDAGPGNDTVTTGAGARVLGGDGDDIITTLASSQISGGAGNDTIFGAEDSVILGGDGDDVITGAAFGTSVDGDAGNDSIDAGIATTITTGTGNDTVSVTLDLPLFGDTWNAGPVTVTDYVRGQDVYLLNNNVDFDFFTKEPLPNGTLGFVQADDDVLVMVKGFGFVRLMDVTLADVDAADFVLDPPAPNNSTVLGTAGADTLTASEETTRIDGLGGNDSITSAIEFLEAVFDGGDGNDTIEVGISATVIGGAGDDVIQARDLMTIDGGPGDDSISAGPGSVVATGTGADSVSIELDINFASDTWNHGPVTITDYVPGQDTYVLNGNLIVDDTTGEPIGRGTLELVETAQAVLVRVNGIGYFRLPGLTLADVDAADFVLDQPTNTLVA